MFLVKLHLDVSLQVLLVVRFEFLSDKFLDKYQASPRCCSRGSPGAWLDQNVFFYKTCRYLPLEDSPK